MSKLFGSALWGPPSEGVDQQFRQFIQDEPTAGFESDFDSLASICKDSLLNDHTQGAALARFVAAKAKEKTPFSIVRMNDGEGCVFFNAAFPNYPDLNKYVVERISEIIFGSPRVVLNDAEAFFGMLSEACMTADIIGIPARDFPDRRLDQDVVENVDVRAICGVKAQVRWLHNNVGSGVLSSNLIFASAWLSKHLLPYYDRICRLFPRVVIVTGNPGLGSAIREKFRLPQVEEILVPTQRALKLKSGIKDVHYPVRYLEVLSELEKIPSDSLVLVAAGLLAKPYCAQVKRFGSSAIDIGHVADIWAGKISRPGVSEDFVKRWVLATSE